jgi:hypothetical protein
VLKRLFWLTAGFGLGVWTTVRVPRAVRSTVRRYVPEAVADRARALDAAVEERRALIRARNAGRARTPE